MQTRKFEHLLQLPLNDDRKGEGGLRLKSVFKKTSNSQPLVTIITVVFNGKDYLESTIQSVLNQSYGNLEYIIIDGGSTDGSIDIIRKYEDRLDYWVSEKDQGISDAFNKGVVLANGDYINFQGDGDGFLEPDLVERLLEGADPVKEVLICGRVRRVDLEGKKLFDSPLLHFRKTNLLFRMALPHQGLFTSVRYFQEYGLFDVTNKFCMDYDHLLRAYRNFPKVRTTDQVVAQWRADGVGNGRTLDVFREYDLVKRRNKVAPAFILSLINIWTILKFKFKTALGR